MTCHKKSRLLFVLFTSVRQAVTVHSPVCVVRNSHVVSYLYPLSVSSNQLWFVQWLVASFLTWHSLHGKPAMWFLTKRQPHASTLSCHSSLSITNLFSFFKYFFYFFVFFLIQYSRSHSMLDIGSELSCSHVKKRIYYNMKKLFCNLFLFPFFKTCHFWNPTESEPFSYCRIVSEVAHVTKIAQFFR